MILVLLIFPIDCQSNKTDFLEDEDHPGRKILKRDIKIPIAIENSFVHSLRLTEGTTLTEIPNIISEKRVQIGLSPHISLSNQDDFLREYLWKIAKYKTVTALLPGMIMRMYVHEGQEVKDGELLFEIEMMKMLILFRASSSGSPPTGIIKNIFVNEGAIVNTGDPILRMLEPTPEWEDIPTSQIVDHKDILMSFFPWEEKVKIELPTLETDPELAIEQPFEKEEEQPLVMSANGKAKIALEPEVSEFPEEIQIIKLAPLPIVQEELLAPVPPPVQNKIGEAIPQIEEAKPLEIELNLEAQIELEPVAPVGMEEPQVVQSAPPPVVLEQKLSPVLVQAENKIGDAPEVRTMAPIAKPVILQKIPAVAPPAARSIQIDDEIELSFNLISLIPKLFPIFMHNLDFVEIQNITPYVSEIPFEPFVQIMKDNIPLIPIKQIERAAHTSIQPSIHVKSIQINYRNIPFKIEPPKEISSTQVFESNPFTHTHPILQSKFDPKPQTRLGETHQQANNPYSPPIPEFLASCNGKENKGMSLGMLIALSLIFLLSRIRWDYKVKLIKAHQLNTYTIHSVYTADNVNSNRRIIKRDFQKAS